jgi:uncharacterized protein DUF3108
MMSSRAKMADLRDTMKMSLSNQRTTASRAQLGGAVTALLAILVGNAAAQPTSAPAPTRFRAHYTVSMTGVPIGQIAWFATISEQRYTTSATGKASGVLSVLVKGEGAVDVRGMVIDGRMSPRFLTSKISDDDGTADVRMIFEDGSVKELVSSAPPDGKVGVPVSEADRRGVIDPLSAMVIPAGESTLSPANCDRVLAIFDGSRRYDLALSYKRVDKVVLARSYSGNVLVCAVVLKPIAGYRSDSALVKYVAGRSDMELWFAPIAGTPNLAPVKVTMPTLLGTLEIAADQFDSTPQ